MRRLTIIVALTCGVGSSVQAQEGVVRTLLDRELRARTVTVLTLDDRTITYVQNDEVGGELKTEPVRSYVGLIDPAVRVGGEQSGLELMADRDAQPTALLAMGMSIALEPPRAGTALLVLTDGQRIAGRPAMGGAAGDDQMLRWEHPLFGVLGVELEQVSRIVLDEQVLRAADRRSAGGAVRTRDRVVLASGDELEGFVAGVTSSGVMIEVEGSSGGTVEQPFSRVAGVDLASESARPSGVRVWLTGATNIRVASMSASEAGELELTPALKSAGGEATGLVTLGDVRGVLFDASRVLALSQAPIVEQSAAEAGGDRRWVAPARVGESASAVLGAADIELPGPMRVVWELPAGSRRVAMRAALPPAMWTWGDCTVVVSVSGAELSRTRLNEATPEAELNVELPAVRRGAVRLTVTVEAGEYGPIQDRVILQRPMILIEPAAGG